MEHRDIIISRILNTAPYQLPPIVHAGGCYSLQLTYLSKPYHQVGITLDEVLQGYLDFVINTEYHYGHQARKEPLTELPVRLGSTIYPIKENF